jgi:TolB protein
LPAWSPDGAKIAWTRSLPGWLADVFVMNADGSGQTRLTNIGAAGAPSWSPDGAKIAFRTTRDGGSSEIYTMNADGTGQVNITNTAETKEWAPAWTPANKIVFVRNYQIYTMNPDGSSPTQVVDDGGINNFPTWSPTTGQIAYNDHDDGEVARINANGTGHTTLTSVGNNLSPSWGPVCTSHPFSDVPAWVTASVDWAFCGSVMSGYPGTTFRPILSISRGQVASALYEAAGSPDTSRPPRGPTCRPGSTVPRGGWPTTAT